MKIMNMKIVDFQRKRLTDSGNLIDRTELHQNNGFLTRGRYLQVSKLEDCRRWRIVLLCTLRGSNDNSQEEKFVRLNMFFQALQQPDGNSTRTWVQWGVLQVISVFFSLPGPVLMNLDMGPPLMFGEIIVKMCCVQAQLLTPAHDDKQLLYLRGLRGKHPRGWPQ